MFSTIHKVALAVVTVVSLAGSVQAGTVRLGFRAEFCEYGMVVVAVDFAGPAHQIGLLPGDILVQINEHPIACFADYFRALDDAAWNHHGHVELWFYRPGAAGFSLLYVEFTIVREQILVHVPCCVHPVKCHEPRVHCWQDKLIHLNVWFGKHCGSHQGHQGGGIELPLGKLPGIKLQGLIDKKIGIGQNILKMPGTNENLAGGKGNLGSGITLQNLGAGALQKLGNNAPKNLLNGTGIRLNNLQENGRSASSSSDFGDIQKLKNSLKKRNLSLDQSASGIQSNQGTKQFLRNLSGASGSNGASSRQSFNLNFGKR